MRRPAVLMLGLLIAGGCSKPFRLDQAALDEEGRGVVAAFEEVALPLPDGLVFRIVGAAEMEDALLRDFMRQAAAAGVDEEVARRGASAQARDLSVKTLTRYDAERAELFVVEENFKRLAIEAGDPTIFDAELVRGMLLHECGRAYAERRFELSERQAASSTQSEVGAIGVLGVGIAQVAARRAARARGWEVALERAISALGAAGDEAMRATAQEMLTLAENTVARMFEAGGESAIEQALADPLAVLAPPDPRHAFDALLDAFVAGQPEGAVRRFETPRSMVRESLRFLPPPTVDRIVAGLELDRSVAVAQPGAEGREGPTRGANFRQHRSPEEAAFLVDAVRRAFEAQVDARVEAREGAGWTGFFAHPVGEGETPAESALVQVGDLSISVFYQGGITAEELARQLDTIVAR